MSPDRIITTRAEAIRRRKEEEQKQREKLAQKRISIPAVKPAPKPEPKPAARTVTSMESTHKFSMGIPAPKESTHKFSKAKP